MARLGRKLLGRLLPWLFMFAAGVAVGFYVRDQQQHKRIQQAVSEAREDMERAIERGRRAGEDIRAGARAAKVAAESTRAAIRELSGDSASQ